MTLLFAILKFIPASTLTNFISNIKVSTENINEVWIMFNEISEVLLTKKFTRVEFLVPLRTFDFAMKAGLEKTLHQQSDIKETPSHTCP